LDEVIDAVRADRKVNVPVVLTREEVSRVIAVMEGVPQLIVQLLYGSGLRILEAVRLRVKDVDFEMKQVTVRSGKGENYAKVEVMQRWYSGDSAGAILKLYLAGGRGSRKAGEICEKTGCFRFRPATAPLQECLGSSPHGGQPPWHNSQWLRVGFARARVHAWRDTPSRPGS
jgi:integrase